MKQTILFCLAILSLSACTSVEEKDTEHQADTETKESAQIFKLIPTEQSGLDFYNNITETQEYNYFRFQYTYNGAGVAIGDIDNDGLDDIYLVGNQVPDKLFLNKGGLRFEDITTTAGIDHQGGFNFGVTMCDINGDGFQDIYVCRSGHSGLDEELANLLYINNGNRSFTESAKAYGLADKGHSIQSAFFDYDRDGDLDMYLTNHPTDYGQNLGQRLEKMKNPGAREMDRLYRNNGNNTFTDVTVEAGLVNYGHGLGLIIWDVNRDGWDDIVVANDYQSADWFYINDQDGTFTDRMKEMFPHIPYYSMGIDAADINNDGLLDLKIVEMMPENYKRKLLNLSDLSEKNYYVFQDVGFHHQYIRNGLFLNTGMDHFADIALMTGMEATDWSWSTLIADFDNDGHQDVFVSNGYLRDMQDKDYIKRSKVIQDQGRRMTREEFNKICQSNKLRNYLYKNHGDLRFENVAKSVGLDQRTFSSGAAYGDLDNDGDLELVINNVNLQLDPDPVFLYENLSSDGQNHIRISFKGPEQNPDGEGVKVRAMVGDELIVRELRRTRGFESAVPDYLHIGLGEASSVDDLVIIWPDGAMEVKRNVAAGSKLTASYTDATERYTRPEPQPLFTPVRPDGLDFTHEDKVLNEFDFEKQLPFRLGMQGPGVCTGDVNGDGLTDVFITGSHDQSCALYLQGASGFELKNGPWSSFSSDESVVAEFEDVDGDGDLDLFIGAGGVERGVTHQAYLDRLLFNDGNGNFEWIEEALPRMMSSTSCITFADMDADGDSDAFIGVRSIPGSYGQAPRSFLLENEGGRFTSVGASVTGFDQLGMVTDATWSDLEGDGDMDLVVMCEWMAPQVFINEKGKLTSDENMMPDIKGFWRSIHCEDLDDDGQVEILLGNIGTNSKYRVSPDHPLRMYLGDLDSDGDSDIMMAYKQGNHYHPDRTFTYLKDQFPMLNQKYTFYEDAAGKSLEQIFGPALGRSSLHEIDEMKSVVLRWDGERFTSTALPDLAQISSVNDIIVHDVDADGDKDIILAGNELYTPIQTGSYDAGIGTVLLQNGEGDFEVLGFQDAGLRLQGWVKHLDIIDLGGVPTLCAWRNKDRPLFYRLSSEQLTSP